MGLRSMGIVRADELRLWSAPDVRFLDEAQRGELFVGWVRLAANISLGVVFGLCLAFGVDDVFLSQALGATAVGTVLSLAILVLAQQRSSARWLPFVSSLLDLSMASVTFLLLAGVDPLRASNLALVYLLIIAATCLRLDARVSLITGAAAILQYAIVAWVALHPQTLGVPVGTEASQAWSQGLLLRPFLLGAGALLSAVVVVRQQRLRSEANHDGLTGLLNRGYFDERFEAEAARAERSGESFTVLLLDVDHFKSFNDTHGHVAGDRALRSVASVLMRTFRASDVLARYGGEEFVGLLFGTRPETILRRIETARTEIASTRMTAPREDARDHVTVSLGVAVYPDDGATPAALLDIADQRLYAAKLDGRNRSVAHGGSPRIAEPQYTPESRRRYI